jgi:hypothetical protein
MILFSSKKMEAAIARDLVTNSQKAVYLGLFSLMYFPSVVVSIIQPKIVVQAEGKADYPVFNLINALVIIGLTIFAITRCRKINSGIDDKNIIERYMLLSIPVVFKTLIVAFAGLICGSIVVYLVFKGFNNHLFELHLMASIVIMLISLFFYGALIRSFIRLEKKYKEI